MLLSFDKIPLLTSLNIHALAEIIRDNNIPTAKLLNEIGYQGDIELSPITGIVFSWKMSDDHVRVIADAVHHNKNITYIDLSDAANISHFEMFRVLLINKPVLKLKYSIVGFNHDLFYQSLMENTCLTSLDLSDNWFNLNFEENFKKIIDTNTSLKKLNISKPHFRRGAENVINNTVNYILENSPYLEELNYSENYLTNEQLKTFANSLSKNTTLKRLDLSRNFFTKIDELCQALEGNNTLVSLNLSGHVLYETAISELHNFVSRNYCIEEVVGVSGLQEIILSRNRGRLTKRAL